MTEQAEFGTVNLRGFEGVFFENVTKSDGRKLIKWWAAKKVEKTKAGQLEQD